MSDRPVIAVTGASGFIGGHIVRTLIEHGYGVRGLTRRVAPEDSEVDWVTGALDDDTALRRLIDGAAAVVHLAGAVKALNRDDFFRHNADGVTRLVNVVAAVAPDARLIHVSSLAAREPGLSDYAASKRAGELALRPFADRLALNVLRPPAVYGPGDLETLRLFQMAARGWVLTPGVADQRMSLIHVADLTMAVLALLHAAPTGLEPVEIDDGADGGHAWPDIARAAMDAVRREARVIAVPAPVLMVAGLAGSLFARMTGRPSMISWTKASELTHPDWRARPSPIPGFTPRWTIGNGFKDAVNWANSRGLLRSYN